MDQSKRLLMRTSLTMGVDRYYLVRTSEFRLEFEVGFFTPKLYQPTPDGMHLLADIYREKYNVEINI